MRLIFVLTLTATLFANSLQQELVDQFKKTGDTEFTALQIALIASGVETKQALAEYEKKYGELVAQIAASAKKGNSAKKTAKNLHAAMFKKLGAHDETNGSLVALLNDKVYSSLTATFLYTDLAVAAGLNAVSVETPLHAYTLISDGEKGIPVENTGKSGFNMKHMKSSFPGYILDKEIVLDSEKNLVNLDYAFEHTLDTKYQITSKQLAALFFLKKAKGLPNDQVDAIAEAISINTLTAPESVFGKGYYDGHFFTVMHGFLQDKTPLPGIKIGIEAAKRFPEVENFYGLLFNLGMLYFQQCDEKGEYADALAFGEQIQPLLGPHKDKFDDPMSMLYFNHALKLYQSEKYEAALAAAGKVKKPHDPQSLQSLKTEAHAAWLDQMDKKGAFPDALALAAKNIDAEKGVNNYLIVLNHYHESLMKKGDFETCFTSMDEAPEKVRNNEIAGNLRYNVYVAWLNYYERRDFNSTIPIYERLFKDESLKLEAAEKDSFEKNYAAMLAMRVQDLINEAHYKQADKQLKAAQKIFPEDQSLKDIGTNLAAILKRLNQQ